MKTFIPGLAALPLLFVGCVYFNTFFNAEKAYEQAVSMRDKRMAKNPDDTVSLVPEEKAKLDRAINKCSKLLELYPDKIQYAPKALFLMGESYLMMGEYLKAVEEYEELARYYPKAPENPIAAVHRARGLYLGGQIIKARAAVEEILQGNPSGDVLREALLLAARMEAEEDSSSAGLAYYEKLLQEKGLSEGSRADVHWEAARLAFDLGLWERARNHALSPEYEILPDRQRFRNEKLALICLYREKLFTRGIEEALKMYKSRVFARFRPDLKLLMGLGYEGNNDWKTAARLYHEVPGIAPRTASSAEAFYRLGDHFLVTLHREDSARVYFDSAAAAGQSFEYGALGAEKSKALSRIAELRKAKPDSTEPHYQNFMIAEQFLFNLSQVDSALARLNTIVESSDSDSVYTIRAAYARAYIEGEFKQDTVVSDSLYRYVLERFPNTEWAKQAEKNLGLKPTMQTEEDKAHALFLAAEAMYFAGDSLATKVIPAYRKVYTQYPHSHHAAQALFVIGFLQEGLAHEHPPRHGSLDSAKVAYHNLRTNYLNTVYGRIAAAKMEHANDSHYMDSTAAGKSSASATEAAPETMETSADTSEETQKRKEVLEPKYDNTDQY